MNSRNNYCSELSKAWHDAKAIRQNSAPTVVSLFAGCGGSSTGYQMAGYRELLAVEWVKKWAAVIQYNYPEVPVYIGDIKELTDQQALDLAGIKQGELDVLDGSPPCQGFSLSGKRKAGDPRSALFKEYIRLLKAFRPKALLMENVSGLVKGKMKIVFSEIMTELNNAGYQVEAQIINAKYHGVPQSRQRLIIIGTRNDLSLEPSHPKPQQSPISAETALENVDNDPAEIDWLIKQFKISSYGEYDILWKTTKTGNGADIAYKRRTGKNAFYNQKILDPKLPAPTLTSMAFSNTSTAWHRKEPRSISSSELKRLGSFPDEFKYPDVGKINHKHLLAVNTIGNSVPPMLARSLALHIKKLLK